MIRVRTLGLALVAVFAISAVAAASASAHEFKYSAKTPAKGTAVQAAGAAGEQVFKVSPTGFAVICKKLTANSEITEASPAKNAFAKGVKYSECNNGATISEAEYEFNAEVKGVEPVKNTTVLTKTITITIAALGCKIEVKPQGPLAESTYANLETNKKLEVKSNIKGIHSKVTGGGGFCGKEGENTEGTYTGASVVTPTEGTIEWK